MDKEESRTAETEESSTPKAQFEPVYPWKKAWQTAKAIWPQLVYISLTCMSIPQYLLFVFSTRKAAEHAEAFKVNNPISLDNSFEVLKRFAGEYLSIAWIVAALFLVGAFTIIALIGQVSRFEPVSTPKALRTAAKTLFPFGLLYILLLFVGSLFGLNFAVQLIPAQLIKFFGLILLILLSALPTLMVLQQKGYAAATRSALRMSYTAFTGISKWSVFFLLMTYHLLAVNLVALLEWAGLSLLRIDQDLGLHRSAVFQTSEAWPFGKGIYFVEVLNVLGFALASVGFIVLSASLIHEIYRRHTLGRTISLIV